MLFFSKNCWCRPNYFNAVLITLNQRQILIKWKPEIKHHRLTYKLFNNIITEFILTGYGNYLCIYIYFSQPPPPELTRVADQMTYKTVTPQQIDFVFSKRDYVVRLTDCLVHIGYCNMSFGLELYRKCTTSRILAKKFWQLNQTLH